MLSTASGILPMPNCNNFDQGSYLSIAIHPFGRLTDMCELQMLFTCVSMVLSLTIFAYILGEISNLVMDQDAELVKTRTQVGVLIHAVLQLLRAHACWLHIICCSMCQ